MRSVVLALFALAALVGAADVIPCNFWPLDTQCDSAWANIPLGSSTTETICTAGCAMTSVTNSLLHANASDINGQPISPASVNAYLLANGGYVDTDLIVWAAVDALSPLKFSTMSSTMTNAQLVANIDACNPTIVNVLDGSHWVLAIGYDSADTSTIIVNDPYFPTTTYAFETMSNFVVYETP